MKNLRELIKENNKLAWILYGGSLVILVLAVLLLNSIFNRKNQSYILDDRKIDIQDGEVRSRVWGINYPKEYESYKKTSDTSFRSKYMGSAPIDELEENPKLVILWAGYGFSRGYMQSRGHEYSVQDIRATERTGSPVGDDDGPMPSTCWACKSPDVPRVMNEEGYENFFKGKWARLGSQVVNPIGCADCHEPKTMSLRVSRPFLTQGLKDMGVNTNKISHQNMKNLVCQQCHSEYFFDKKPSGAMVVTFPWKYGYSAEGMEKYYDEDQKGFADYVHPLSRAKIIKAQHPDGELFELGIHAKNGVTCVDCHMPYTSEGGMKFTDHHIRSPLSNIQGTCATCHRGKSEETLKSWVYERQDKAEEQRGKLEDLLVKAHIEAKYAWDNGATEDEMKEVLALIRASQWRWDYVAATHGGPFHAPIEYMRVVSSGMDKVQEARVAIAAVLGKHGKSIKNVVYPDISTKEKAQRFVGIDVDAMKKDKANFLKTVVPKWDEMAKEREAKMPQYN